jgi:CO/xanthine dehydrogenase FAD-binding subunit
MLPRFSYISPRTIDEAVDLLGECGGEARILAGGTDLLIGMGDSGKGPKHVIDIKRIRDLCMIRMDGDGGLRIGSCVTVNELMEFSDLPSGMEGVLEAAGSLATYQLRNRATVGGNICNASPACDLGPPLMVLDASLRVVSKTGERRLALIDLFTGVKTTCLGAAELVAEIIVPSSEGTVSGFMKRKRIRGHDLATVNAAGAFSVSRGLRIAMGAVAPRPVFVDEFDGAGLEDKQKIIKTVLGSVTPVDDIRSSSLYRRYMVEVLVGKLIDTLIERSAGRR